MAFKCIWQSLLVHAGAFPPSRRAFSVSAGRVSGPLLWGLSLVQTNAQQTCVCVLSHIAVFNSLQYRRASLSKRFSRQEYWSGCRFLLQGIYLIQGSNPHLLWLLHGQADSLPLHPLGSPLTGVIIPKLLCVLIGKNQ